MTGPNPQKGDGGPHVVPTTMDEIMRVGREHGVSPAGFFEGCRPAFGVADPYGSLDGWRAAEEDEGSKTYPVMVGMCRAWIRCFGRNARVTPKAGSSYGFKHEVERHFGRYICNGAFIVAAYLEGLIVQRISAGSPNAYHNLSVRDLRDKARRLARIAA